MAKRQSAVAGQEAPRARQQRDILVGQGGGLAAGLARQSGVAGGLSARGDLQASGVILRIQAKDGAPGLRLLLAGSIPAEAGRSLPIGTLGLRGLAGGLQGLRVGPPALRRLRLQPVEPIE